MEAELDLFSNINRIEDEISQHNLFAKQNLEAKYSSTSDSEDDILAEEPIIKRNTWKGIQSKPQLKSILIQPCQNFFNRSFE